MRVAYGMQRGAVYGTTNESTGRQIIEVEIKKVEHCRPIKPKAHLPSVSAMMLIIQASWRDSFT